MWLGFVSVTIICLRFSTTSQVLEMDKFLEVVYKLAVAFDIPSSAPRVKTIRIRTFLEISVLCLRRVQYPFRPKSNVLHLGISI